MTDFSASRTRFFTESVIREMTRLAAMHGAMNLAQGFPDFPAPDFVKQAAVDAINGDVNQYAITWGSLRLRQAIADKMERQYGLLGWRRLSRTRSYPRPRCRRWIATR